jgi:serine/threonine protein kinase
MMIGGLKKHPTIMHWPLEQSIKQWVTDEEASAVAKIVERCLHLVPEDRPSAKDLLSDPWFEDII